MTLRCPLKARLHPLLDHWRFLSVGFLMVAFSAVGQTFVPSLFGGEWRATFGLSHGGLGLAYSAATLLSTLLLIAAGHLVDRAALPLMIAGVVLGAQRRCARTGAGFLPAALLRSGPDDAHRTDGGGAGLSSTSRQGGQSGGGRLSGRGGYRTDPGGCRRSSGWLADDLVADRWAADPAGWVLLGLLGRHCPRRPTIEVGSSDERAPWNRAQVLRDRRF